MITGRIALGAASALVLLNVATAESVHPLASGDSREYEYYCVSVQPGGIPLPRVCVPKPVAAGQTQALADSRNRSAQFRAGDVVALASGPLDQISAP